MVSQLKQNSINNLKKINIQKGTQLLTWNIAGLIWIIGNNNINLHYFLTRIQITNNLKQCTYFFRVINYNSFFLWLWLLQMLFFKYNCSNINYLILSNCCFGWPSLVNVANYNINILTISIMDTGKIVMT